MKYLQLKFVILFQQKNKFVGKYCFYGCWCFPQAAMFQWQGFGQPVDNIGKIIYHIVGLIDVGNGCWRRNVLETTLRPIKDVGDRFITLRKSPT